MAFRGFFGLSGATPGICITSAVQRMSLTARCAGPLRQGQSRWSTLLRTLPSSELIDVLAHSCISGELTEAAVTARMHTALGHRWRWTSSLARRFTLVFQARTRPSFQEARRFLQHDERFGAAWSHHREKIRIERWIPEPHIMQPVDAAARWAVPQIETVESLCGLLGLTLGELEWFSDLRGIAARSTQEQLRHYHYRILQKPAGGLRLIEAPKEHLKQIQRAVLRSILEKIPVHPAVHGFVPSRNVVSFAAPHVGKDSVIRVDLKNFFPSVRAARIQAFFRTVGYPDRVASFLTGLCTSPAPRLLWVNAKCGGTSEDRIEARELYTFPHLPQGAPTSPALANVCAYRMDCRLDGLARSANAVYTRYADDLVFSGGKDFRGRLAEWPSFVGAIAAEEGFLVNYRKTRAMSQATRQQIAGVVVNQKLNVAREEADRLKAVLTNCMRFGPFSQNREQRPDFAAYLRGKVSWVSLLSPTRGERLRRIYDQILWES